MKEKSNNVLDLVYTVSETAQILKVNKNTVYDLNNKARNPTGFRQWVVHLLYPYHR